MLFSEFVDVIKSSQHHHFPVEDRESGRFLGMIFLDRIRPYLYDPQMHSVLILEQVMETHVPSVQPDEELSDVLNRMDQAQMQILPVVDNERFIGMLSKATLLDHYRKELVVQTGI
jgi:CIC family chloride channel protein